MGHDRGHFAHGGEAIAQPLALLDLFDVREVLEEHGRAHRLTRIVPDQGQRVANHGVGGLQAQLCAIGQRLQLKRATEHADDVGMFVKDVGVGAPADLAGREAKQPARLVIDEDQRAIAIDREDAVAHVPDHVPEEHVFELRRVHAFRHQHVCRGRLQQSACPERWQRLNALSRCDYRIWIMDYFGVK